MSRPEALAGLAALPPPGGADGPVFPAPWAARAFALTLALHERGLFAWSDWTAALGAALKAEAAAAEPEAYWRAWLSALERLLTERALASPAMLADLREAWREAAAATPHGEPVLLRR